MAVSKVLSAVTGGLIPGVSAAGTEMAIEATEKAAGTQAAAQMQALEYLKEREAIPQRYREAALTQLGGLYGLPGIEGAPGVAGREEFISGLREDPFYREQIRAGEEAVLRGASATGGLRSGGASEALARVSPELLRGVYQERIGGLRGLAGLPSYAPQIASAMGEIGRTRAAGIQAVGQQEQRGLQELMNIGFKAFGAI